MSFDPIFYFSIGLIIIWITYFIIGNKFAIDYPDERKTHNFETPQIGGLVFVPLFLAFCLFLDLIPNWYFIGGIVSVLLGSIDDTLKVKWQYKLLVQLMLMIYLSNIFWGRFDAINFYIFSIKLSDIILLVIFLIWFIGIYNAVNLLDGLDGLAGGYVLIVSAGLSIAGNGKFFEINSILTSILLAFLVFNQRPAKLFMGDGGSLFLGFHIAVLPLLFAEVYPSKQLFMTPFILIATYLIADTTRVFFTRLASKKNPMNADTIHFHHLILNQSGSYLTTTGSIYFTILLTVLVAILSFNQDLSSNIMILHLTFIMLFVLVPPVNIYIPFLTELIKPIYSWQKKSKPSKPFILRTLFMASLLICLILSILYYYDFSFIFKRYNMLAILLLILFSYFNRKENFIIYIVKLFFILILAKGVEINELNIFSKIFTTLICISYIIFTFERRIGCKISRFSSLDILVILICLGGVSLSLLSFPISYWFMCLILATWFSTRFILCRTIYLNL
tara:strand:- start:3935 stop:5449 length:1515 start_codon:yes stop_codon:yes gene_type:complete